MAIPEIPVAVPPAARQRVAPARAKFDPWQGAPPQQRKTHRFIKFNQIK